MFTIEARRLLAEGNPRAAAELCRRGLSCFPENPTGYVLLAHAFLELGEHDRAANVLADGFRRTGSAQIDSLRRHFTRPAAPEAVHVEEDPPPQDTEASIEPDAEPLEVLRDENDAFVEADAHVEEEIDRADVEAIATESYFHLFPPDGRVVETPADSHPKPVFTDLGDDLPEMPDPGSAQAEFEAPESEALAFETPESEALEFIAPVQEILTLETSQSDALASETSESEALALEIPAPEAASAATEEPASAEVDEHDDMGIDDVLAEAAAALAAAQTRLAADATTFTDYSTEHEPTAVDVAATPAAEETEEPHAGDDASEDAVRHTEVAGEATTMPAVSAPLDEPAIGIGVDAIESDQPAVPLIDGEQVVKGPFNAAEPAIEERAIAEQDTAEPDIAEQTFEEPVIEEQHAAEPIAAEPVAAEPAGEEPIVEEPAIEEPPAVEQRAAEPPVVAEPPRRQATVVALNGGHQGTPSVPTAHREEERTPRTMEGVMTPEPAHRTQTLALHSVKNAQRLRSSNLRLIPGLEFAPLRHEDHTRRQSIAPLISEPMPQPEVRRRPRPAHDSAMPPLPALVSAFDGAGPDAELPTMELRAAIAEPAEQRAVAAAEPQIENAATPEPHPAEPIGEPAEHEPAKDEPTAVADHTEAPMVADDVLTPLEELARRLENARIPAIEEADQRRVFESSLVSETLANILVSQGAYAEALKAFRTLARAKPERQAYFEERIEELKSRIGDDAHDRDTHPAE